MHSRLTTGPVITNDTLSVAFCGKQWQAPFCRYDAGTDCNTVTFAGRRNSTMRTPSRADRMTKKPAGHLSLFLFDSERYLSGISADIWKLSPDSPSISFKPGGDTKHSSGDVD